MQNTYVPLNRFRSDIRAVTLWLFACLVVPGVFWGFSGGLGASSIIYLAFPTIFIGLAFAFVHHSKCIRISDVTDATPRVLNCGQQGNTQSIARRCERALTGWHCAQYTQRHDGPYEAVHTTAARAMHATGFLLYAIVLAALVYTIVEVSPFATFGVVAILALVVTTPIYRALAFNPLRALGKWAIIADPEKIEIPNWIRGSRTFYWDRSVLAIIGTYGLMTRVAVVDRETKEVAAFNLPKANLDDLVGVAIVNILSTPSCYTPAVPGCAVVKEMEHICVPLNSFRYDARVVTLWLFACLVVPGVFWGFSRLGAWGMIGLASPAILFVLVFAFNLSKSIAISIRIYDTTDTMPRVLNCDQQGNTQSMARRCERALMGWHCAQYTQRHDGAYEAVRITVVRAMHATGLLLYASVLAALVYTIVAGSLYATLGVVYIFVLIVTTPVYRALAFNPLRALGRWAIIADPEKIEIPNWIRGSRTFYWDRSVLAIIGTYGLMARVAVVDRETKEVAAFYLPKANLDDLVGVAIANAPDADGLWRALGAIPMKTARSPPDQFSSRCSLIRSRSDV